MTLKQLRETLHLERERDMDLEEQHARLTRQNALLILQNLQLNEEREDDVTDSESKTESSEERGPRQRRTNHEDDGGERRRRRRRKSRKEKDLRRALEITRWEDQRRRYEEERMRGK